MKNALVILLFIINLNLNAQVNVTDTIEATQICLNEICLLDSLSHVTEMLGKSDGITKFSSNSSEWSEVPQTWYKYGRKVKDGKFVYDLIIKERVNDEYKELFAGFKLNTSVYNCYINGIKMNVGDSILDPLLYSNFPSIRKLSECKSEICRVHLKISENGKLSPVIDGLELTFINKKLYTIHVGFYNE